MNTRHTVQIRRRTETAGGPWNNQVETFSPPAPGRVYGWFTPSSNEPGPATGDNRAITHLQLLAPEALALAAGDLVDTPYGPVGHFRVIGRALENNASPFSGWRPGVVWNLTEVTG